MGGHLLCRSRRTSVRRGFSGSNRCECQCARCETQLIALAPLLGAVQSARKVKLLLIDADQDDLDPKGVPSSGASASDLRDAMIFYSTKPGQRANDTEGNNSFTKSLVSRSVLRVSILIVSSASCARMFSRNQASRWIRPCSVRLLSRPFLSRAGRVIRSDEVIVMPAIGTKRT